MKLKKRKRFSLRMPNGYNRPIHIAVILLMIMGVLMVTSVSMTLTAETKGIIITFIKALAFLVLGYIVMVFCAREYRLVKIKRHIFTIILIIGGLLLVPRLLNLSVGGAYAWIPIPLGPLSFTIQPSEFAKIVVVLVFAVYLGDQSNPKIKTWDILKIPFLVLISYAMIIVFIQKDLGSALVMSGMAVLCFLLPTHPSLTTYKRIICISIILLACAALWLMSPAGIAFLKTLSFLPSHYLQRFSIVSNPFADRYNQGFQIITGLIAFTRGGLFGVGFGQSLIKYMDLTAAQTDMILSIVVEELGFLFGFVPILLGYGVIIYQSFRFAFKTRLEADKIVLLGGSGYLFLHFLLNVGGITALIPLTGVPLLFISSGGTSLIAICAMMGIMQSIIAKTKHELRKSQSS